MSVTLKGSEQSLAGEIFDNLQLELSGERITAKELIRSRVFQKVKDYNVSEMHREDSTSDKLVPRDESEQILNGHPEITDRMADWQTEFHRAVESFRKKQILVLVDEKQLTDLDEVVQVDSTSEISFLRLTMLAGG